MHDRAMSAAGGLGRIQGIAQGGQGGLNQLQQPQPPGFMSRVSVLVDGLDGLQSRLELLVARIDGNASGSGSAKATSPIGLGSQLSDAENRLQSCAAIVDELSARF